MQVLIFFDTIINVIIEKEEMEMSSPIKPLADRVVAVREKAQPVMATVVAVGPKVEQVAVGDKIVYKEYSTTDLKINETEYLIVKEDDVLATV